MNNRVIAVFLLIFLFASVTAAEFPNYYDKYVNDFAGMFDENETGALRVLLAEVDTNTTAEMVVVTINTTEPYAPGEYRTKLFNYWKIGKPEKDNGLLILYAVSENRIEVETGYGLEGILPDSKLGRMLDDYYVPLRDSGQVKEGIIAFAQETAKVIHENRDEVLEGNTMPSSGSFVWVIFGLAFIALLFFVFIGMRKKTEIAKAERTAVSYREVRDANKGKRAFMEIMIFIAVFILFFGIGESLSAPFIVGAVILLIFSGLIINFLLPPRCSEDKTKLKFWKNEGRYKLYKCKKGHIMRISAAAVGGIIVGGLGRPGSRFGGGGFGGGMSGAGGVGR
ncbi:MAG: TPM domain-containing protein [Candidatus Pacearchaeota archaeon]